MQRRGGSLRNFQPLTHFGQRVSHGVFADANQFIGAFEVVIIKTRDVGLDNNVGCASPNRTNHLLRDGERLSNHIEEMARRASL